MAKNHSVTVTITSRSDGDVNQEVGFTEYASSAEELVAKHFAISDKVVAAVNAACVELAAGADGGPGYAAAKARKGK